MARFGSRTGFFVPTWGRSPDFRSRVTARIELTAPDGKSAILIAIEIAIWRLELRFHPRFGWIKKGYDAAAAYPNIFNVPSAPVELGVGKNMVEAIRFWAFATKVITRLPHPQRPRLSVYTPTRLGRALLDDEV